MTQFGPYALLRRLGSGGNAEVFLATGPNPAGADRVALKLILPHLAEDPKHRRSLLREAEVTKLLQHRNVVQIYDVGEFDERPFLSMEYVPGWSLAQVLKALKDKQQPLTLPEACSVVRETALGLHYAHEAKDRDGRPLGLVHRDISPQNLMLRDDGQVKVVDFGIAKATLIGPTQTGGMKGKLAYMPPEQIEGKEIDRRADVFAVGAVLWELLSGQRLYPGQTEAEILQQAIVHPPLDISKVLPGLPRELREALKKSVERNPSRRFSTALELADALKPWVSFDSDEKLAERLQRLFNTAKRAPPRTDPPAARRERPKAKTPPETPSVAARAVRRKPSRERLTDEEDKKAKPSRGGFAPTGEVSISAILAPPPRSPLRRVVVALVAVLMVGGVVGTAFVVSTKVDPKTISGMSGDAPHSAPDLDPGPAQTRDTTVETAEPKHSKTGTLILSSDVPAFVQEGRRDLGMTPLNVPLSAGTHKLSVRSADKKFMQQVVISIRSGKETVREVLLIGDAPPPE